MDKKKIKEFFADKKNRRFAGLSALTFLGLIGALALQAVWLYNVYTLIRNDIQKECTSILDTALYEETNIISSHIPDGYEILGGPQNDSISSGSGISEGRAVGINGDGWHFSGFRIPVCGRPPPHRAGVGFRISGDGRAGIVGLSPSFGPLPSRSDGTLLTLGRDSSHVRTGPLSRSDGTGLFLSPRPLLGLFRSLPGPSLAPSRPLPSTISGPRAAP